MQHAGKKTTYALNNSNRKCSDTHYNSRLKLSVKIAKLLDERAHTKLTENFENHKTRTKPIQRRRHRKTESKQNIRKIIKKKK